MASPHDLIYCVHRIFCVLSALTFDDNNKKKEKQQNLLENVTQIKLHFAFVRTTRALAARQQQQCSVGWLHRWLDGWLVVAVHFPFEELIR